MKKIFYSLLVALAAVSFVSCSGKDDDPNPTPNPDPTPEPGTETVEYNDFVILNRGSFDNTQNDGSLSYYAYSATNNSYTSTALTTFSAIYDQGIGLDPKAMATYNNYLFVIISMANKIDIIDTETMKVVKEISFENEKFRNPRQIWIDEDKAYVTLYDDGTEYSGGYVAQYDCKTLELLQYYPAGQYCNKPDGIVVVGNYIYVAYNEGINNDEGYEPGDLVIRVGKNSEWGGVGFEREPIKVGLNPTNIITNGTEIFVLCAGDGVKERSKIYKIENNYVGKFFAEGTMMNIDGNYLYVINDPKNGVSPITYKRYSVADSNDVTDMIDPNDGVDAPTAIAMDRQTGNFIITSATVKNGTVSETANGYYKLYSKDGKKLLSGDTGIDPFDGIFLPKSK